MIEKVESYHPGEAMSGELETSISTPAIFEKQEDGSYLYYVSITIEFPVTPHFKTMTLAEKEQVLSGLRKELNLQPNGISCGKNIVCFMNQVHFKDGDYLLKRRITDGEK